MSILEDKLVSILKNLKENYGVIAVRSEFESEGATREESLRLKDIALRGGVGLTVKVGGCEAKTDIYSAKRLEASSIIAPMVETSYSMEKFVKAIDSIYSEKEKEGVSFYINVETITGFNNLSGILSSEYADMIDGVVLGRVDMAGSLGLGREDLDSDKIFTISRLMSEQLQYNKKDMVIGGGITKESIKLFKKLAYLSRFETRKVVFDTKVALNDAIDMNQGLLLATSFELIWLEHKKELGGLVYKEDQLRLGMLKERYMGLSNGRIQNTFDNRFKMESRLMEGTF